MYYDSVEITGEAIDWYKKSKNNPTGEKYIAHSDQKVGSINIDWAMDMEAVEKLVDAIQENVFEHDGVKLDVKFNTDNW